MIGAPEGCTKIPSSTLYLPVTCDCVQDESLLSVLHNTDSQSQNEKLPAAHNLHFGYIFQPNIHVVKQQQGRKMVTSENIKIFLIGNILQWQWSEI